MQFIFVRANSSCKKYFSWYKIKHFSTPFFCRVRRNSLFFEEDAAVLHKDEQNRVLPLKLFYDCAIDFLHILLHLRRMVLYIPLCPVSMTDPYYEFVDNGDLTP